MTHILLLIYESFIMSNTVLIILCLTEDLETFYKQRRRWGPSTTANVYQLILNQREARKNNSYIRYDVII